MKVLVPGALYSYTRKREVQATGGTVMELLGDLDRQYPGLRFRVMNEQDEIRTHVRFFINGEQVFDPAHPLHPSDTVEIVQALSGG